MYNEHYPSILVTFWGETEHFSGKNGALRWSILVGKQKHNVQKPTRQPNAASNKSLEIQASCIAKQRTLFNRKFVYLYKGFKVALISHESRNSEEAIVS